jgi:hypothetical protein
MMPFSERLTDAKVICFVCRTVNGHDEACPIVALDHQVKELTSHVGVFVSNMQDTMERIGRILRDESER